MPKRKKYPRLPNAFGSIRYLGKGRSLPYAVHPPATDRNIKGDYIRPKAICYVPDWYTGFAVLSAYHAGTYTPGLELTIRKETEQSNYDLDLFCRRVLRDHAMSVGADPDQAPTFKEVYELWYQSKYGPDAPKKLSASSASNTKSGCRHCSDLYDLPLNSISVDQLQQVLVLVAREYKETTVSNVMNVIKAVYRYGITRGIITFNAADALQAPDMKKNENGVPFTDNELKILWEHRDDQTDDYAAEMMFIMCFAGYRVRGWIALQVDLNEKIYTGGNKTAAGKDLVTPIHSYVLPLVERRMKRNGALIDSDYFKFRRRFSRTCARLGIGDHTPHDTKHTFSRLCEKFGVRENDRKRMMGHAIGNLTNDVYGHRDPEDLRQEIEKIHFDFCDHL